MRRDKQNRREFLSQVASGIGGLGAGVLMLEGCSGKPETAEAKTLYTYDLTDTLKLDYKNQKQCRQVYDQTYLLSSLQGLVNREEPRLYIFLMGAESAGKEAFWLRRLPSSTPTLDQYWLRILTEDDGWLANTRRQEVKSLGSLMKRFRNNVNGLVVYDEKVPSTSCVASTVAGVENLLCVRFDSSPDSLYQWLTTDSRGPHLPVKVWLVSQDGSSLFTGRGTIPDSTTRSTGSAKCDAYIWAKEKYLDTGRCNPQKMAYYVDAFWLKKPEGYVPDHMLSNHDYFIAKKAFFFDLSPWGDEAPNDDPSQPVGTDQETLQAILRSAWDQLKGNAMICVGGFPPFNRKYTTVVGGKHEPVATEWRYAAIISCFNGYMVADTPGGIGDMANASAYQHYPLKKSYPQTLPTLEQLKARGYITPQGKVAPKFYAAPYVGDYDSTAWIYQRIPDMWSDPARGSVPLGWAFNPNLSDRFGPGMAYVRRNKSANDFFVAGDSGAGYLNPMYLVKPRKWSSLPSGLDVWTKHCEKYFRLWDISITGFIIEGEASSTSSEVMEAYTNFSQNGIGLHYVEGWGVRKGMPHIYVEEGIQYHTPEESAARLLALVGRKQPDFLYFRTILMTPSEHKKLFDMVKSSPKGKDVEFVDPYTLFLLIKTKAASMKA
jgi:hypothetical protein